MASGNDAFVSVRLKEADEPLSVARVAITGYAPTLRFAALRWLMSTERRIMNTGGFPDAGKPVGYEDGDLAIPVDLDNRREAQAWLRSKIRDMSAPEEAEWTPPAAPIKPWVDKRTDAEKERDKKAWAEAEKAWAKGASEREKESKQL